MKAFWREGAYGFWHYQAGRFKGVVGWDSTKPKGSTESVSGYKVTFLEQTLVKRFQSLDEAKQACEHLAKTVLEEALAAVLAKMNL